MTERLYMIVTEGLDVIAGLIAEDPFNALERIRTEYADTWGRENLHVLLETETPGEEAL